VQKIMDTGFSCF